MVQGFEGLWHGGALLSTFNHLQNCSTVEASVFLPREDKICTMAVPHEQEKLVFMNQASKGESGAKETAFHLIFYSLLWQDCGKYKYFNFQTKIVRKKSESSEETDIFCRGVPS